MGHDMTMRFETCKYIRTPGSHFASMLTVNPAVETIAFILAVLVVIYTVQDGKSNYLEGVMVSLSGSRILNLNPRLTFA